MKNIHVKYWLYGSGNINIVHIDQRWSQSCKWEAMQQILVCIELLNGQTLIRYEGHMIIVQVCKVLMWEYVRSDMTSSDYNID